MEPRTLIRFTLASGIVAAMGVAGCSLVSAKDTDSAPDEITAGGDVSAVMKSTLQLQDGCPAAKVGARHLLLAARCVSGNQAYVAGATISFTSAAGGSAAVAPPDAGASDAGRADAAAPKDAGTDAAEKDAGKPANKSARSAIIAEVKVHPSYAAKCTRPSAACTDDSGRIFAANS